jgi:dolichol-phosphate mannosyltransferase
MPLTASSSAWGRVTDSSIVVIPTYNEVDTIGTTIDEVVGSPVLPHVLIVDDASPDGTAEVVRTAAIRHPGKIHLLSRQGKDGLGAAYRAGFDWALARGYDVICQMDADGSHPAERLAALVAEVVSGRADLAAGSRYVAGGACTDWTRARRALSRAGNAYARLLLGLECKDATGGFRAWRREALVVIDPATTVSSGYGFQVEMATRAQRRGFRTVEVPIVFTDRQVGTSKMSRRIAVEALLVVIRLRHSMAAEANALPEVALAS